MQRKHGISLIVLIITIIIMIILASAVIISLNDGKIIDLANQTALNVEIRSEEETLQSVSAIAMRGNVQGTLTVEGLQKAIDKSSLNITAINNGDTIVAKFNDSGRYYELKNNGKILGQIEVALDNTPGSLDGTGREEDPFVIMSIEDLVYFSKDVTINKNTYANKYVILGRDLNFNSDLSYVNANTTEYDEYLGGDGTTGLREQLINGKGFVSIGKSSPWIAFCGIFDGQNKVIDNLYINNETLTDVGLFGYVERCANKKS